MNWRRNSIVAVLLLLAGDAVALKSNPKSASSCMSRSEAKAAHRGAYLYWHRNAEGQRCWSARRVKSAPHAARRVAPEVQPRGEEVKEPVRSPPPVNPYGPYIPYGLLFPNYPGAPLPIPVTREQSIFDYVPWTSEAYAATPEPQPPPQINRDGKGDKYGRATVTADMVMVLVAAWLISFMVGTTLYRWVRQRDQLRIG